MQHNNSNHANNNNNNNNKIDVLKLGGTIVYDRAFISQGQNTCE